MPEVVPSSKVRMTSVRAMLNLGLESSGVSQPRAHFPATAIVESWASLAVEGGLLV